MNLERWKLYQIKDLGIINIGNTPSTAKPEYYASNSLMFVTSKDIQSHFITETEKKLSLQGEKLATIAPANSLLVTCYTSIGKNSLTTEKCAFNQSIINLIPYQGHVPYFLLLMSEKWSQQILKISCGSTFKGVNKNTL